jgi:membrane protein DedA with SNARE-associated domain
LGLKFVNWLSRRFPAIKNRLDWLTNKLSGNIPLTVAIARLTPGLLTPSTVASGVMCQKYHYFILGIIISSVVADGALLILGFATASGLKLLGFKPSLWFVLVGLGLLVLIGVAIRQIIKRRSKPSG